MAPLVARAVDLPPRGRSSADAASVSAKRWVSPSARRRTRLGLIPSLGALLAALTFAEAQKGSPYRCRNKNLKCTEWAARGECSRNYEYMADSCPVACSLCGNAGLEPTPAFFEFDYVCNGRLVAKPTIHLERHELPDGCTFRCRDNMTDVCRTAAANGECKTRASLMRFQCPDSCGVCKGLSMTAATADEYPLYPCARGSEVGEGDEPAHKASCPGWKQNGECLKNWGFMSVACEESCGLCSPTAPRMGAAGSVSSQKRAKAAKAAAGSSTPAAATAKVAATDAPQEAATAGGTAKAEVSPGTGTPPKEQEQPAAADPKPESTAQSAASADAKAADGDTKPSESSAADTLPEQSESAGSPGSKKGAGGGGFWKGIKTAFSGFTSKLLKPKVQSEPREEL